MRAGAASRTAYGVALRRAAHQILDRPPILEDPVATKIVGYRAAPALSDTGEMARVTGRGSRQLRAFVAARSRYAEDELAASFADGLRQYVVLGAGLDTFAYRNPYSGELRVWEVDHPDTQAWKKECLRAAEIATPESVTFLAVDFERQRLATVLEDAAGFDTTMPSFFSLLGVTPYLTREALMMTLGTVALMPAGSSIVFDYAVPALSLKLVDRIALKLLSARVAAAGESFRLFLEPKTLAAGLHKLGFSRVEDLGQQEINSRYFQCRTDGLRIRSAIGRLVSARV